MRRCPIVLAHGIARLDYLVHALGRRRRLSRLLPWLRSDRLHYFRGIASYLRRHGFATWATSVSFAAGVEVRGRDLRGEILRVLSESGQSKVHIIGHSMGGLDARRMIVHEGMADRVASLTTIGTPHLGTSFADAGIEHGGHAAIDVLGKIVNLEGFEDLTTAAMRSFNDAARDAEVGNAVVYRTYASSQTQEHTFLPLQPSWKVIFEAEGENDGLVSTRSQAWEPKLIASDGAAKKIGQSEFPVRADHLNQVGWWHINNEMPERKGRLPGFVRERRRYETRIRNLYLQIAREVEGLS